MLPDHALHAGSIVANHHARAGSKRMEVARCKWGRALLRPARTGRRTSQRTDVQLLQSDARQQCCNQRYDAGSCGCSCYLHECGSLETKSRDDRCQHRRTSECGCQDRTSACQRTSTGTVYGWNTRTWLSAPRHGIRAVGSAARCAHLGSGSDRYAGQAGYCKFTRRVLRPASVSTEALVALHATALAVAPPASNDGRMRALSHRQLQCEQTAASVLQGPSSSW
jgi:hypothetical protein